MGIVKQRSLLCSALLFSIFSEGTSTVLNMVFTLLLMTLLVVSQGMKREKKEDAKPLLKFDGKFRVLDCDGNMCVVKCRDGPKVELSCPDNSWDFISHNGKTRVYCGSNAPKGRLVRRMKREKKEGSKPLLECGGSVNYKCKDGACVVKCGDGTKVELSCPNDDMSLTSINGKSKVYCGPNAPKVNFPRCFPFCNIRKF